MSGFSSSGLQPLLVNYSLPQLLVFVSHAWQFYGHLLIITPCIGSANKLDKFTWLVAVMDIMAVTCWALIDLTSGLILYYTFPNGYKQRQNASTVSTISPLTNNNGAFLALL